MQQIKDILRILDLIVGTYWSITVIDILPIVFSGELSKFAISSLSALVNLLLAIAGLVYLVIRIVHFLRMSKLHIEYRRQEILEKERGNFPYKWRKEFIDPFPEEKKEN